ncbi:MAG TPA: ATP-binding protein [Oligoflexus sp.]|uniref:ATP-binding protein n=1 Tax=Oligoflexus sp. TaxID=1971216 RepID=UPI002D4EF45D|nr:ATP-binding protein [Oligoflexus sp.]HYX36826.1 ATP-binding protein [Oligoflexus sp.]
MRILPWVLYIIFCTQARSESKAPVWPTFGIDDSLRATAQDPAINLESRAAVEFAIQDYPNLHVAWLRQKMQELNPEAKPVAWVRACWALTNIDHVEDQPYMLETLAHCVEKAEHNQLYLEWADLAYNLLNFRLPDHDLQEYEKHLSALVAKVRTFQDPNALAFILSMYAIDLMRFKILDRSLPLISEASSLMESTPSPSLIAYSLTKNALGNSLRYRELHDEAIAMDRILAERYAELGIRMLTLRIRYSLGFSLLFQSEPNYAEARTAMVAASKMADDIKYRSMRGSSSSLLSLISSHYGEHDNAVRQSREAVEIFIAEGEQLSQAYAEKRLAEVLIAQGEFQKAMMELDNAQRNMIDQNQEFKKELSWFRYKCWLGLHDKARALAALETYTLIAEDLAKQREKNEYNRAAASLGLQLAQEKTKTLEQENRWQSARLQEAERFRLLVLILAVLSISTLSFLFVALRQIKKVRLSRAEIQRILDNIDEGLLTVDAKQTIGQDYSHHLSQMVGINRQIAGQDFVNTVFSSAGVPSETRAITREVLNATLHETRLAWDLNADNLPKEIHMGPEGESTFLLRWIPIWNRADTLDRILVSLTDITQTRALEKALGARDKKLRTLPETLRELLAVKPDHFEGVMHQTETTLARLDQVYDLPTVLRELHTQKGLARTLGLRELSQDLHDMESALQNPQAHPSWQELKVEVHELILEYRTFANILHQERRSQTQEASWLATALDAHLQTWREHMNQARLPIHEFQVMDGILKWDAEDLMLCRDICLHAINNSLDHGFIFPQQKGETLPPPILSIRAQRQVDSIILEISDNGIGLQNSVLENLAKERKFMPGPGETLVDVLFTEGVSSADSVTITSGRGIGLAAVKTRVLEHRGRVSLHHNPNGRGTVLRAEWPAALR